MSTARRVLVVGLGIGGLAAASCFARRGAQVDAVELRIGGIARGVGLDTTANGCRVLREIGVLERCLEIGYPFDTIRFCDAAGRVVVTQHSRLAIDGLPGNLGLRRDALHDALTDAAAGHGAHLEYGVQVLEVEQRPDAPVRVRMSDGRQVDYDLVVGADGIRSTVRREVDPGVEPTHTGFGVWRATVPRPDDVVGHVMQQAPGIKAGLCPISEQEMYLLVVRPTGELPSLPREEYRAALVRDIAGFGGAVHAAAADLPAAERIAFSPIEEVRLPGPWSRGRVVVIGDAAHACAPHLAQGASMAMEDASVLAELCTDADDLPEALAAFQRRRAERVGLVQEVSRQILLAEMTSEPADYLQALAERPPEQARELGEYLSAVP